MTDSINSPSNISIDEAMVHRDNRIIKNMVVAEHTKNKSKSNHSGYSIRYDPSLDLPIALRKGTRSFTKHSICNYVSHENLSPQFRAFIAILDLPQYRKIFIL